MLQVKEYKLISDIILSFNLFLLVLLLYLYNGAWFVPLLLVSVTSLSLYLRLKCKYADAVEKGLSILEFDERVAKEGLYCLVLFIIIPSFMPQLIFALDWSNKIQILDLMAQKIAYLYDDMYHTTGAIRYISTSIGTIRVPSFFYGLRNLSDSTFPWFNVNMFIFFSINVMVAYASLIASIIFLSIRNCRSLICCLPSKNFHLFIGKSLIWILCVFLSFISISWDILFGKSFNIFSAHIKILVINALPFFCAVLHEKYNFSEKEFGL